jgi:hypothetical protein
MTDSLSSESWLGLSSKRNRAAGVAVSGAAIPIR